MQPTFSSSPTPSSNKSQRYILSLRVLCNKKRGDAKATQVIIGLLKKSKVLAFYRIFSLTDPLVDGVLGGNGKRSRCGGECLLLLLLSHLLSIVGAEDGINCGMGV